MLKTNKITRDLKARLINNGYMYVSNDIKIVLLEEALNDSICDEIGSKNRREYSLEDVVTILNHKTKIQGDNRELFSSYINSVINIIGEIQGSVISWNRTEDSCIHITELKYNEFGLIEEIKSNKKAKLSSVLLDIMKKAETKQTSKLLVK